MSQLSRAIGIPGAHSRGGGGGGGVLRHRHGEAMSQLSRAIGIPGAHSREGGGGTPTETWGGHVTAEPGHRYPGRPLPGGGGGVLRQRHEGSMSQLSRAIGIPGAHSREGGGGGYSDRDMRGPCHS